MQGKGKILLLVLVTLLGSFRWVTGQNNHVFKHEDIISDSDREAAKALSVFKLIGIPNTGFNNVGEVEFFSDLFGRRKKRAASPMLGRFLSILQSGRFISAKKRVQSMRRRFMQ